MRTKHSGTNAMKVFGGISVDKSFEIGQFSKGKKYVLHKNLFFIIMYGTQNKYAKKISK